MVWVIYRLGSTDFERDVNGLPYWFNTKREAEAAAKRLGIAAAVIKSIRD